MEIIRDLKEVQNCSEGRCIALGTFDGVHLGHQSVLKNSVIKAKELGLKSAIFTFSVHPLSRVVPRKPPPLLNTMEEKAILLEQSGVEELYLLDFTPDLASLSPRSFVEEYLVNKLNAKEIVVGFNYTFARARQGTVELLESLGLDYNFGVEIVKPFYLDGDVVSSTRIRRLINEGKIEAANNFLGYSYFLQGEVVHGYKRGREIGFPTANVDFEPQKVVPATGVYAVTVELEGQLFPGVTNIGYRPTFKGQNLSLEVHILDFSADIYGKVIKVNFLKEIRRERPFDNIDQLIEQISLDVQSARKHLTDFKTENN